MLFLTAWDSLYVLLTLTGGFRPVIVERISPFILCVESTPKLCVNFTPNLRGGIHQHFEFISSKMLVKNTQKIRGKIHPQKWLISPLWGVKFAHNAGFLAILFCSVVLQFLLTTTL